MSPASSAVLAELAEALACPNCGLALAAVGRALRCAGGHGFDLARQGYVSLLTGAASRFTGDTADMLQARSDFHARGHFAPVAAAVATAAAPPEGNGVLLEIGAGNGYFLGAALDAAPGARGIALDIAKPAARRAARAHPRAAAVLADVWRGLPLRPAAVDTVLTVFAPRNPAEVARVLAPEGRFVVATPTERHLAELIGPLGLVRVDPDKERKLAAALEADFFPLGAELVEYPMALTRADAALLVYMGPSAFHAGAETAAQLAALPDELGVTASVRVGTYIPRTTP
ncbi:putative RNA methyltransferase [Nocardia jiangsuensis]|uniref:RNA methyltransferase n=1 Tax=Nocardia jiangsuensis TaxID=1691563 RepID=A0ABV8DKY9_9NOCA